MHVNYRDVTVRLVLNQIISSQCGNTRLHCTPEFFSYGVECL